LSSLRRLSLPLACLLAFACAPTAFAGSPTIVVSQVYGGGGNSGATLPQAERFGYVFEGDSQTLDHILVGGAAAAVPAAVRRRARQRRVLRR
jgi:hypothetical protein